MEKTSPEHTHIQSDGFAARTTRRMAWAAAFTSVFVVGEAFAGLAGHSLALLTDAAHNFTDVIALALSWYALRLATRPAHAGNTFGYHRAGILVALLNSTTLVLISLGILYEAYVRFMNPPEVNAPILIIVGSAAFILNFGTALLVAQGSDQNLTLRSAFVHLMGDVLSTLGAAVAGVIIAFTSWNRLDPLVSVLISCLILWNAWGILRQTVQILLESTPDNIDIRGMVDDLLDVNGVRGVHDLHVWSISQNLRMLSAHIVTDDISISSSSHIQSGISATLEHKYNIHHATLQLEVKGQHPDLLYCNIQEHQHLEI